MCKCMGCTDGDKKCMGCTCESGGHGMHQTLSYDVKCMGYTGGGSGIPDQVGPVPTSTSWYAVGTTRYAGGTPGTLVVRQH